MIDCKSNLEVCKASCCKGFSFILHNMTQDAKHYYELHNCEIRQLPNRQWEVFVHTKCNALTEDNLCSLHGTDDKPKVCQKLDWHTKDKYHITKGCLLLGKEDNERR